MWTRIIAGAVATLAGLALQLAMVAGAIEAGLALSLGGHALVIAGMVLALVGVLQIARRH